MADDFSAFPEAGTVKAAPTGAGEFDAFPQADNDFGLNQILQTVGGQVMRGGLESTGTLGGTMLGVRLGAMTSPITGPAGPIVGGVLGAAAGYMSGEEAAAGGLRIPSVEQLPEALRPFGYFGQSLGGAGAFAAAPYAAAVSGYRFGESMVGNYLNQIIETAKSRPILTGLTEASSAFSAATAAGLSEALAKGEAGVRATAEMLGGIFNPTKLAMQGAEFTWNTIRRAAESFSPAARETAAGKILSDLLAVTGEDPTVLARILRDQGIVGAENLTAAQKTGSLALAALEDHLAKFSNQFGAEAKRKAMDGLDALRGQITLLSGTGDPAALTAAAQARSVYFRTLIQGRLDSATKAATEAAAKITQDTPAARAELSKIARNAVETSIADARKAESELWNAVDGNRQTGFENLQRTYNEARAELLPEVRNEKLPPIVQKFLDRVSSPKQGPQSLIILPENLRAPVASDPVGTTVKEMRQLRSELLDLSRSSTNAGEYGQARIYSNLAESVLDDMDAAFAQTADTAYDSARTFSRELNDTFSRSFAGKVTGQGKYGDRIAPELTLRKALASGKEAGAIQLQELEEATRFMVTRGLGDDQAVKNMLDAQERIIRLAAADAIDPLSGKINQGSVAKFIRDNEILMNRFPEVRADLQAAVKTEEGRMRMENLAKRQVDVIMKQKAFSKLLETDPITMANKALLSTNQEKDLGDLITIAKSGGKEAIDGMRASVFDAAIRKSTNQSGVLNIEQMRGFLFSPSVAGQKSPIQIMQDSGVIDADQVKNIKKLFDTADAIIGSQRPGTAIDVKTDLTDAALATISRMIGSGVAGATARAAGSASPSLIVHGAGARLAETAMTKLPTTSAQKFLIEAMNDPMKMALLLEKADTPEKQARQARQIHAWLVQSGLTGAEQVVEENLRSLPPVEVIASPLED